MSCFFQDAAPTEPYTLSLHDALPIFASEVMFFGGLFAMWFTLRSMVPDNFGIGQANFTHGYAIVNTTILVSSSFTCQFGVWVAEGKMPFSKPFTPRKRRTGSIFNDARWGLVEWFTVTFVLGAIFVSGQAYEYAELVHEGVTMSSSAFSSVFYLATGFHGTSDARRVAEGP